MDIWVGWKNLKSDTTIADKFMKLVFKSTGEDLSQLKLSKFGLQTKELGNLKAYKN